MLSAWLRKHYQWVWWTTFIVSGWPFAQLIWNFYTDQLGVNPLERLIHASGTYALVFLLLSLLITPLRRWITQLSQRIHSRYGKRLSDWNWVVRLRRMIGLYAAFYASVHLGIYLHFDLYWDWSLFWQECIEQPYLLIGLVAFIGLIPLVVTSNNFMMKRLGKKWRQLHRLVYLITVLVILHYWWQMRGGATDPWFYTLAAAFLLGYRFMSHYGWIFTLPRDDGMEVPEREQKTT